MAAPDLSWNLSSDWRAAGLDSTVIRLRQYCSGARLSGRSWRGTAPVGKRHHKHPHKASKHTPNSLLHHPHQSIPCPPPHLPLPVSLTMASAVSGPHQSASHAVSIPLCRGRPTCAPTISPSTTIRFRSTSPLDKAGHRGSVPIQSRKRRVFTCRMSRVRPLRL